MMRLMRQGAWARIGAAAIGLTVLLGPASLTAGQNKPVTASDAWVRLPADGETTAVAVASVENPGMYAIYLISGTSDVAAKVEFRDASKGGQVLDDVAVINYETTYMDPKGVHMVLSGLKRPLKEGETVHITLKTDGGVSVEVSAVVKKP
jgi:periplasmic copper chaperone A